MADPVALTYPVALTDAELSAKLEDLDGWEIVDRKLRRVITFSSFAEALGFMVRVGVLLDKRNHHPEWVNVYNRLTIDFITHDVSAEGGITMHDIEAAQLINDQLD